MHAQNFPIQTITVGAHCSCTCRLQHEWRPIRWEFALKEQMPRGAPTHHLLTFQPYVLTCSRKRPRQYIGRVFSCFLFRDATERDRAHTQARARRDSNTLTTQATPQNTSANGFERACNPHTCPTNFAWYSLYHKYHQRKAYFVTTRHPEITKNKMCTYSVKRDAQPVYPPSNSSLVRLSPLLQIIFFFHVSFVSDDWRQTCRRTKTPKEASDAISSGIPP